MGSSLANCADTVEEEGRETGEERGRQGDSKIA